MGVEDALGHVLKPVTLPKPRSCDVCKEIIWSSSLTCQGREEDGDNRTIMKEKERERNLLRNTAVRNK